MNNTSLIIIELVFIAYLITSITQVSFTPYLYRGVIPDTNWNDTNDTNSDTKLILIINKLEQYVDSVDTNDTKCDTTSITKQMILMIPNINN